MAPALARVDESPPASPPKVAFVSWNGILGGAQTFSVEMAGALRARDIDAHVVFVCESAPLDRRAEEIGVPWATVGLGRGSDILRHPRRLAKTVAANGADGAVLVSSGYLAAALRAGGYRAPLVAVEHGTFLQVERLPVARRALRRLDRRSGLWACSVEVAVSEFLLGELRQRAHARSLVCIPNGVDLQRFAPLEGEREPDEPIIGCAARLVPGKGLDDLIRAVALLRETGTRLQIAGDGPDRQLLEELAQELGVGQAVEFLGRVDDMPAFWRSCMIAVVPSHELIESFGLVAIEAMASGVPVVATRNGGLVEVVGEDDESGILVQSGAPAELAAAISGLLDDEDLRASHGRNGRSRVERLHSLDACADSYAKLIASVVRAQEAAA
jgi:glycosyltransferase involved in cell wall biosynthesis